MRRHRQHLPTSGHRTAAGWFVTVALGPPSLLLHAFCYLKPLCTLPLTSTGYGYSNIVFRRLPGSQTLCVQNNHITGHDMFVRKFLTDISIYWQVNIYPIEGCLPIYKLEKHPLPSTDLEKLIAWWTRCSILKLGQSVHQQQRINV